MDRRGEAVRWGVGLLCLVQFVDVLGVTSATTAIPRILQGVGAPRSAAGLLATTYAMFFGGLLVVGARLADRWGPRRALLGGVAAFAVVALVGATAAGLVQVLAARALQGAAAALSVPAALHLLLHLTPSPAARGRALAAWTAAGGAAGAAGFVVGGLLTDLVGWRSVFWVNAPVAVALLLGVLLVVPEVPAPPRDRSEPLDAAGAALLITAVMALVVGAALLESPRERREGAVLLAIGLLVGAVFLRRQRTATAPLVPLAAFRSADLRLGAALSFVNTASTSSAAVLATLLLQDDLRASPLRAGLALLPLSAGAVAGSAAAGVLAARLVPRQVAALGLAGIGAGVLLLAVVATAPWGVPAGAALTGAGLGVASVAANGIGTTVPAALASSATGILNTGAQLGTALGVAALVLLASATSTALTWAITAAAVAVLATLLLRSTGRRA